MAVEKKTFGDKVITFVYESTFAIMVIVLGPLLGLLMGVLLPLAIPLVLLWQRYASPQRKMARIRRMVEEAKANA